ncbi:hypothetical protein Tco_0567214 [Tanacetum coccineum]
MSLGNDSRPLASEVIIDHTQYGNEHDDVISTVEISNEWSDQRDILANAIPSHNDDIDLFRDGEGSGSCDGEFVVVIIVVVAVACVIWPYIGKPGLETDDGVAGDGELAFPNEEGGGNAMFMSHLLDWLFILVECD